MPPRGWVSDEQISAMAARSRHNREIALARKISSSSKNPSNTNSPQVQPVGEKSSMKTSGTAQKSMEEIRTAVRSTIAEVHRAVFTESAIYSLSASSEILFCPRPRQPCNSPDMASSQKHPPSRHFISLTVIF